MKRLRILFATVLFAALIAFSSCNSTVTKEVNTREERTAYIYSCTGEPIDTISNIYRFYRNGSDNVQLNCSDGSYVHVMNMSVIIK